jgi:hypothetical protein
MSGRIEFVSYGPVVHFRLLPTPSHDDAVTFSFNVIRVNIQEDSHLSDNVRSQAH